MTRPIHSVNILNPSLRRIETEDGSRQFNATFIIDLLHAGEGPLGSLETKIMTRISIPSGEDRVENLELIARQQLAADLRSIVSALE